MANKVIAGIDHGERPTSRMVAMSNRPHTDAIARISK
jgi:hypothetical protein